jgi:cell wall-associated NlpC family hydrolase
MYSWLNTPYQHQGRLKSIGVDCSGLIIGIARELGLKNKHGEPIQDLVGYPRALKPDFLETVLLAQFDRTDTPQLGDMILFRIKRTPQHLGILTQDGFIHAYAEVGKVVETRWDAYWRERVVAYYRWGS